MIKRQLHIWLAVAVLAGCLAGCFGTSKYDERLVTADSLLSIPSERHTALSQLTDISPASLNSNGDRAYHALLMTQATYLNYIPLTSDSLINEAVNYYEHHKKEADKLTRAYLYKGAVLEDLLDPATAMTYYKKAEVTADADKEKFYQGYALLRMGKLYFRHYALDGRDIEKIAQALKIFRELNDTAYQIICLRDLGALYRSTRPEYADSLLNEAIGLTEMVKDTANFINSNNNLAYLYYMQECHAKAYKCLQRIKKIGLEGLKDNVYTTFACVYANIGKPDSALLLLQMAGNGNPMDSSYYHTNNYLEPMSQIAKAKGDLLRYYKLSHEADSATFELLKNPNIVNIMYSELSFDQTHKAELDSQRRHRNLVYAAIISAIMLTLLLLALIQYRRSHRYDKLILELKDQSQSQMNDLKGMQQNISELRIKDERLKGFITSHMSMMQEMIEACYHGPNNRITENMKRIVKFQDSNRDNWEKLYDYIDVEHDNIMSRTRENYPQLNDRELLLLALTCMGYSYIQTAIIMGYSNATSVSVIKQRLVKKMGLECTLNEYIENSGKC